MPKKAVPSKMFRKCAEKLSGMQRNRTIFKKKGAQNHLPTHCTKVITSRNHR